MSAAPLITFLSDFGRADVYVGVVEGVIAGICPRARVIHLTHEIAPRAVDQGSFRWAQALPHLPAGGVHVGVVDPGVGSERAIVLARTARGLFLAPDNGLLDRVLEAESPLEIRRVENRDLFLETVSSTFHGRDIFAPVAAHLAAGLEPERVGPPQPGGLTPRLPPLARREENANGPGETRILGRIEDVDRFGNAITGIRLEEGEFERARRVRAGGLQLGILGTTFSDAPEGETLVLVGSSGWLEVAVNGGSAQEEHGLHRGVEVEVWLT